MTYTAQSKDEAQRWAGDMRAQGYSNVQVRKLRGYWNVVWSPRRTARRDSETGRAGTQFAGRPRKNPTKAQKLAKARKASVERRVALALAKFLKQANPAMKTAGAALQRLKGGVLKITPIKANAAKGWKGWDGWVIPGVKAGFRTKKAAERHIRETRMFGVKPVKYRGQKL